MKTPDEIKRALDCCSYLHPVCEECPYYPTFCDNVMIKDALEYIQQLEADNERLKYTLAGVMHFVDKWLDVSPYNVDNDQNGMEAVNRAAQAREEALAAIEQLEAERDAAVNDLTEIVQAYGEPYCEYCEWNGRSYCTGRCWTHNEGFKWRGVQKEG